MTFSRTSTFQLFKPNSLIITSFGFRYQHVHAVLLGFVCQVHSLMSVLADGWWYIQDNASVHTARVVDDWMSKPGFGRAANIPPCSPDRNPIENMFRLMLELVSSEKLDTVDKLAHAIQCTWNNLPLSDILDFYFFGVIIWLLCVLLMEAQPDSNLSSPTMASPLPIPHTTLSAFYLFITHHQFCGLWNSLNTLHSLGGRNWLRFFLCWNASPHSSC